MLGQVSCCHQGVCVRSFLHSVCMFVCLCVCVLLCICLHGHLCVCLCRLWLYGAFRERQFSSKSCNCLQMPILLRKLKQLQVSV